MKRHKARYSHPAEREDEGARRGGILQAGPTRDQLKLLLTPEEWLIYTGLGGGMKETESTLVCQMIRREVEAERLLMAKRSPDWKRRMESIKRRHDIHMADISRQERIRTAKRKKRRAA